MATTISLSYDNTINVFDYVTQERIGQVSPSGDDEWAVYAAAAGGERIIEKRIDTVPTIQAGTQALDAYFKAKRRKLRIG